LAAESPDRFKETVVKFASLESSGLVEEAEEVGQKTFGVQRSTDRDFLVEIDYPTSSPPPPSS
jgi:hypothetical protein